MARTFKSIQKDMTDITRPLFGEIMEYCKKHNSSFEDFMEATPPMIASAWVSHPKVKEWLTVAMTPAPQRDTSERQWFYKDQPDQELAEQSVQLLTDNFITCNVKGHWQSYKIEDRAEKLVSPVVIDDGLRAVQKIVKDQLWAEGCALNTNKMRTMWDYYVTHSHAEKAPVPLAQPDEDTWAFSRIKTRPDASVPFPHIQAFLDRVDDPEGFAAWHYGVHSGKLRRGRQILWLEGPGEDGKSIWFDTFGREFGTATATMTASALKEPKFMNALIENKHFSYIPDCKNSHILLTEGFQNMSSGGFDMVPIEHKYGGISMGYIDSKWAIGSNYKPHIINETFNKSRTLWFTLQPFTGEKNPAIGDIWAAEMPGFLAYAAECYAKRCVNDYEILVNDVVREKKNARISDATEPHDVTLELNFVLEEGERLTPSEMAERLKEYGIRDNLKQKDFHQYLEREHGVTKQGKPPTYRGIRLRDARDDRDALNAKIRLVKSEVA